MELLMRRFTILIILMVVCLIAAFSCGEKMKLPTETPPTGNLGDTLYLSLNPPWDAEHGFNFSGVSCLYFGKDTYLYVVDTGNNRILQLDAAGTIHSEFAVDHPISVTQDELMRLLVVSGDKKIYRIDVGPTGDRQTKTVFDYDQIPYSDTTRNKHHNMIAASARFLSITDFPENDKSYFVAVASDSVNDGKVFWFAGTASSREYSDSLFDSKFADAVADTFRNPVVITGNGITTTTRPNSIYAYTQSNTIHLIVCQDSGSYPVHDLRWERQAWDRHWVFTYTHTPSEADILTRNFFSKPKGATIDPQGNIYVVESDPAADCGTYKFSKQGMLIETMCDADSGNYNFNSPTGITYDIYGDRRTVYVADTGNNRILRFKLSTDLEN
jgi:hypothetical protein